MMGRRYISTHEKRQSHAKKLMIGLVKLPKDFVATICWGCDGLTTRKETFTHGCGGGYYSSTTECSICQGEGLLVGGKPAPESVTEQVLNVGETVMSLT